MLKALKTLLDLGSKPIEPAPSSPAANPSKAGLLMLPERFVVFDLETTGLEAGKHEIIEIGAVRVERDSDLHTTFQVLVKPEGRISAKITEITGIDRKMVNAEGTDINSALSEFREFVGDLPLVAFNAEFDTDFIKSACYATNTDLFENEVHCALKLARKAWRGRKSYSLDAICKHSGFKAQTGGAHRALPDCERALHVFVAASRKLAAG